MRNQLFLFLFTIFVFGTACNNDDDGDIELTGFDRIVDKNFRINDFELVSNGQVVADNRDLLDCELDNIFRYNRNETASTRYGTLRCDPNEPAEITYFWTFIAEETKLILDYSDGSLQVYNVLRNDGSRLQLQRFTTEDINNDGTPDNVIRTYWYVRN